LRIVAWSNEIASAFINTVLTDNRLNHRYWLGSGLA